MVQRTEQEFSKWCSKQNYFSFKIPAINDGCYKTKREADFFVANNDGVFYIECKECNSKKYSDRLPYSRLTQKRRINLMLKKTNNVDVRILINFMQFDKVVVVPYNVLIGMYENNNLRPVKLRDFDGRYVFCWKNKNLLK